MQTVLDPKNSTLEFFAGSFFIYNLSHKQILLTLRRFKENFKLKLLDFLNKKVVNSIKLTKRDKKRIKSGITSIELSIKCI